MAGSSYGAWTHWSRRGGQWGQWPLSRLGTSELLASKLFSSNLDVTLVTNHKKVTPSSGRLWPTG